MDDEIDLPELPLNDRPLKRCRASFDDVNTSSDPIFSSDGPEPSAEDYTVKRTNKRHFRGSWWDNARPSRRIGISRKIDSGIYMGSDETEDSLPDTYVESSPAPDAEVESTRVNGPGVDDSRDSTATAFPFRSSQYSVPSSQQLPANEEYVRTTILQCVESNRETIDLSNLALESVPSHSLDPLQQIIKIPRANDRAPSPEFYESFKPSLKLILSGNRLRRAPLAIFNLEYLTVLSLRGNKLTELPGSINRLRNLTELNIANNRLRWLPYELLTLLGKDKKLNRFTFHPNPFVQGLPQSSEEVDLPGISKRDFPVPLRTGQSMERFDSAVRRLRAKFEANDLGRDSNDRWVLRLYELGGLHVPTYAEQLASFDFDGFLSGDGPKEPKNGPIYICKSDVTFYRVDGSIASNPKLAPSMLPLSTTVVPADLDAAIVSPPKEECAASVPSLFELALRKCIASPSFSAIHTLLPDDVPDSVSRGLRIAADVKRQGGEACAVCGRQYIIKRTEWIEYWHYSQHDLPYEWEELFIPFIRCGCSWRCVG